MAQLCHYIHLNPVRAGIVTVEQLADYRYSSYWYYRQPRPTWLDLGTALGGAGQLNDTPGGWKSYEQYLAWENERGPAGKNPAYQSMSKGWAIGSREFKQALIKEDALAVDMRAWDNLGAKEFRRLEWELLLEKGKAVIPESERSAGVNKSAPWKIAVASWMKNSSNVSNDWLAERLGMGSGMYVSKHVGLSKRGHDPKILNWTKRLNRIKDKA